MRAKLAWAIVLVPLALFEKYYFIDFQSGDFLGYVSKWLGAIRSFGLGKVYGYTFSNYAPAYTYLLGLANALFPTSNPLYLIKGLSFAGEAFAAFFIYRIVALAHVPGSSWPLAAALLMFAAPTVIANSASAAQCDIWYTSFLLAAFYALLRNRPLWAMACFGISISFKLQGMFFAPFILLCLFKRRIPWHALWIPPAVYLAFCVPAWLEGRPLLDLLLIYRGQFNTFQDVGNAANLYVYLHNYDFSLIRNMGIAGTAYVALVFAFFGARQASAKDSPVTLALLATLSVAMMPYLLPKMIDRYFFAADIFSLVLVCMRPQWFGLAILFQLASCLAIPGSQFPVVNWQPWVWWPRREVGAWLNTAAIAMLLWLCHRHLWKKQPARVPPPLWGKG